MVSLENTRNPKGGFTFENVISNQDEHLDVSYIVNQPDTIPLTAESEPNYKKIKTTFAICLQIFTVVVLEIAVFVIPHICGSDNLDCPVFPAFDIVVFIHGGFWFIKLLFDRFYHFHHMKMRRHGYLEFYRLTRYIRYLPLLIVSASNSILVILIKIIDKYCPIKCTSSNLEPVNFLQIFISIETAILIPALIYYLVQTIRFNKAKKSPDINKEIDRSFYSPAQLKDVGYRDSSYLNSILENQADMIRYLQERNEKMSQKLLQITEKTTESNIN